MPCQVFKNVMPCSHAATKLCNQAANNIMVLSSYDLNKYCTEKLLSESN